MKTVFTLILVLLIFLISCKKTTNTTLAKVKTITQQDGETDVYTYNADGRVNLINSSNGAQRQFTYTGQQVSESDLDSTGVQTGTVVYFLNAQLLADSIAFTPSESMYNYKNTFDANGYVIREKWYNNTNNMLYINATDSIVNGNRISLTTITYNGDTAESFLYNYGNLINSVGYANQGLSFYGSSSKNLHTSTFYPNGNSFSVDHYTFDDQGRVASDTDIVISNYGILSIQSYTYY